MKSPASKMAPSNSVNTAEQRRSSELRSVETSVTVSQHIGRIKQRRKPVKGFICAALMSFLAFGVTASEPVTKGASVEPEPTVAQLTRLRRGINASHWFAQVGGKQGYTKAHFDTHTTEEDIALIKAMGFD